MTALRRLQNLWILWVATFVLVCFSNAFAQAKYKVQDLGVQRPDNLGMAMGLNNHGGSLIMDQLLDHFTLSTAFPAVAGTVRISSGDRNLELGTLGGEQFDQLERNQRPMASRRYVRNIGARSEWRRCLRFRHAPYL